MPVTMRDDLSIEYLNRILRVDPETGILYWKIKRSNRKAGSIAGRSSPRGYVNISIDGPTYRAHRIVFALHYGRWPIGEIDHLNRIKSDNRIENLAECTRAENGQNRGMLSSNTSGYRGVSWDKHHRKWRAAISRNGKSRIIGNFDSAQEAGEAYLKAAQEFQESRR
jgi:hypothetical protein